MKKYAILIGNAEFDEDSNLPSLRYPSQDVYELKHVLQKSYDKVVSFVNEDSHKVFSEIHRFIKKLKPQDLLLFYFSGHGYLSHDNKLWLCTSDTHTADLETSAINYDRLSSLMDRRKLKNVIVLLDCCHSGAVVTRDNDQGKARFESQLEQSNGRCVLASSTAVQKSKEDASLGHGVFTHYLLEGITSGLADVDNDGLITTHDIYHYIWKNMQHYQGQTPLREVKGAGDLPFATAAIRNTIVETVVERRMDVKPQTPLVEVIPAINMPNIHGHTEIVNGIPVTRMKKIPGGEFLMGADSDNNEAFDQEKPQHKVIIPEYYLGATTVTFEQYDAYCEKTGKNKPTDEGWGRGKRPVINVSWEDAQAYIQWLNDITQRQYRLPTEAEWEYACRAGTTTRYYWGNEPSAAHANGDEEYGWPDTGFKKQTAPVASFEANPFGLFDMSGNVWEWCEDTWHDNYQGAPKDGSAWVSDGKASRVLRGGSCNFVPWGLRSSLRFYFGPSERISAIGFRLSQAPAFNL